VPALAGSIAIRNLALGGASLDFVVGTKNGLPTLEVTRASQNVRLLMDV